MIENIELGETVMGSKIQVHSQQQQQTLRRALIKFIILSKHSFSEDPVICLSSEQILSPT